jgi:cytochrome c
MKTTNHLTTKISGTTVGLYLITTFLFLSGSAIAQDGAALYAAKACVACHGVDGNQTINDSTPKIAGQNKGYLIQQIKDIKSGARNNGLSIQMKGIVGSLSDEDIATISEYLSGL